ncbi:MAG: hypothetical protein JOS17DRAFT_295516 [Linnemannia elongata]|nr:MAG: hypothetical protein JOS17DRAFT_295516 [Linnemannia elongata]
MGGLTCIMRVRLTGLPLLLLAEYRKLIFATNVISLTNKPSRLSNRSIQHQARSFIVVNPDIKITFVISFTVSNASILPRFIAKNKNTINKNKGDDLGSVQWG